MTLATLLEIYLQSIQGRAEHTQAPRKLPALNSSSAFWICSSASAAAARVRSMLCSRSARVARTALPGADGHAQHQRDGNCSASRECAAMSPRLAHRLAINQPSCNCRRLFEQATDCAWPLAFVKAGKSRLAKIAMTTRSSIEAKATLLPWRGRNRLTPLKYPIKR